MLTNAEYTDLWDAKMANNVGGETMPPFNGPDDGHLLRENQLEDYLDIFRGINTRPNRGNDIVMPYPHPFFNADGSPKLSKTPCIKYILVGEAAPPFKKPIKPVMGCLLPDGDKGNTYFYDIRHLRSTSYLSSPLNAFCCPTNLVCPENKVESLLCLATKGVLLLDLFPFSIAFTSTIRNLLNRAQVTESFWNDPANAYNLQNRLTRINTLLCKDWDLCLVAPPRISKFVLDQVANFPSMVIPTIGIHPTTFRHISPNLLRSGKSEWKKFAVDSSNFNVNVTLIMEAFDLPKC